MSSCQTVSLLYGRVILLSTLIVLFFPHTLQNVYDQELLRILDHPGFYHVRYRRTLRIPRDALFLLLFIVRSLGYVPSDLSQH